jgi:membrane-associated protein
MSFVRKFGKFFGITEENISKVKDIFHKYDSTILFLSKITMGLGFSLVTLITAGLVKIPLKRFAFWNALGEIIWVGGLMAIGFYLGNFYLQADNIMGKVGILASFVIIFILLVSIARQVHDKLSLKKSNG